MKRIMAMLAGLMLVISLAVVGAQSPANALTCTNSGGTTGDRWNGSWTRHICADNGATVGLATVSFRQWFDAYTNQKVSYDMSVTVDGIKGNDCVYIALDWEPSNADHSDAQIMRNCRENTAYAMSESDYTFNLDKYCFGSGFNYCTGPYWFVNRLQVGIYDPDTGDLRARVCPDIAPGTDTDGECWKDGTTNPGWYPNGGWGTKAAKIHRKANDGTEAVNDPQGYDVRNIIDPAV